MFLSRVSIRLVECTPVKHGKIVSGPFGRASLIGATARIPVFRAAGPAARITANARKKMSAMIPHSLLSHPGLRIEVVQAVAGRPKCRRRSAGDRHAPKKGGQFGEVVGRGRLVDGGDLSAICLPIAARQIARQIQRAGLSRFYSRLRGSLSVCPICLGRHR